ELMRVGTRKSGIDLNAVLTELGKREILSVLLEAGPSLNGAAIAAGLVDKFVLFYAPKIAGHSKVPFASSPLTGIASLHDVQVRLVGHDICVEAYPRRRQA